MSAPWSRARPIQSMISLRVAPEIADGRVDLGQPDPQHSGSRTQLLRSSYDLELARDLLRTTPRALQRPPHAAVRRPRPRPRAHRRAAPPGALRHCREVARQTEEHACCFKPNSAFWEQYGPDGWKALLELRDGVRRSRRSSSTPSAATWATRCAPTRSRPSRRLAWTRRPSTRTSAADSLEEFTRYEDRGVYVVCRTLEPGRGGPAAPRGRRPAAVPPRRGPGRERSTRTATSAWSSARRRPTQIAEVRHATELPFLIPGVGAQGGDLEASVRAAWNGDPASCLISSSRSILFADNPARAAADMKAEINAVVGALA